MKKITISIVVLVVVVLTVIALSGSPRTQSLGGASFVETYQKTANAVLLDVRTPSEYVSGHIASAVNVDFENPSFVSEIQKLDKSKTYFVYCRSGSRSGRAIVTMKQNGFNDIRELQGGIVGNQDSLKLVTAPNTP